jgi:cytochrome c-type biogenesis protein CcmH/NrfG
LNNQNNALAPQQSVAPMQRERCCWSSRMTEHNRIDYRGDIMKKESIVLVVVALIIGGLIGVIYGNAKKDSPQVTQAGVPAASVEYQQKIQLLEGIVKEEPGNRGAWVQLGHNYFDSNQPMQAIKAYDKALELDGNDPNVLTDQGIMYRRIGWFDKAIANFTRASELNPQHLQALFNLGIVYRFDTGDLGQAKAAWNRYLELSPTGEGSDKVRELLGQM